MRSSEAHVHKEKFDDKFAANERMRALQGKRLRGGEVDAAGPAEADDDDQRPPMAPRLTSGALSLGVF